jgi:hypothetical protein
MIIAGGTSADFVKFLRHDLAIWSRVIAEAGIRMD